MPGTLWPRLTPAPALGPRVRASLTPAFLPDPHFLYSGVPSPGPARSASHGSFARAPRLQGSATPSGCAGTAPPRPDQRPTSVPPWSRCRRCVRGARAPVCRDTGALPSEVCSPAGAPPGPCARPGQPPRRVEGGGARELDPPVRRRPRRTRPREAETRARATSAAGPSPPRSGLAAPGLRAIHPQPPGPSATAVRAFPARPLYVTARRPIAPCRGEAFPARADTSPRADQSRPPPPAHAPPLLEQSRGSSEPPSPRQARPRGRPGRGWAFPRAGRRSRRAVGTRGGEGTQALILESRANLSKRAKAQGRLRARFSVRRPP